MLHNTFSSYKTVEHLQKHWGPHTQHMETQTDTQTYTYIYQVCSHKMNDGMKITQSLIPSTHL